MGDEYLSDKALGVSPWIATSVAGGAGTLQTVNISHIGPAAAYTTIDPLVEFDITSDITSARRSTRP
jgi:hypothetical protein